MKDEANQGLQAWTLRLPSSRSPINPDRCFLTTTSKLSGESLPRNVRFIPVPLKNLPRLFSPRQSTLRKYHELLIKTNKILIAAVNGTGIGYGTSSLALFDLVYAVPEAYFFTPFVKWGLCAEACSSVTFSRIMGRQKAAALLLADERLSAAELERAGLITKIIPAHNFMPDVLQIARRIARLPPRSLAFNKELMMKPLKQELLDANEAELAGLRLRARDSEPGNAIKAFTLEQERKRKEKAARKSHL